MSKKTILVIDDETTILRLLETVLKREGYEVSTAAGGFEALKWMQKKVPDLVILDVGMPDLNGWDVLSAIRAMAATRQLPVLMCTQKDMVGDVDKADSLGATGYIPKPFDLKRVVQKVHQTLNSPSNG